MISANQQGSIVLAIDFTPAMLQFENHFFTTWRSCQWLLEQQGGSCCYFCACATCISGANCNFNSAILRTSSSNNVEVKVASTGSNRCNTCRKRVGLTGFSCKCGNLFCATHRYSEKHDCTYDYLMAGQDAITKANLVVKAEKLDKI